MTIAALRALLDEIDRQGGPKAARQGRLDIPDERTPHPVSTAPSLSPTPSAGVRPTQATAEAMPIGQLLKWGDEHPDSDVRDQAARARIALTGLRQRHAADQELTALTTEREQLEKRLAELQAREAELLPAKKPKAKRKPANYVRDYDTRTVRAWSDANGIDCPRVGQLPKHVLDAWRTANTTSSA